MDAKGLYNWGKRYITVPLIGIICFVIYVCFLKEGYSVADRLKYEHEIEEINARIADNRDSLEHYRALNARLETSPEDIERIVRENYHMQRANEDVYVFE